MGSKIIILSLGLVNTSMQVFKEISDPADKKIERGEILAFLAMIFLISINQGKLKLYGY